MQLTKAEEQIMQILWELKQASVQDILKEFKDSTPARTTVATILSILETKGFANHEQNGRANIYFPLLSKNEYSKKQLFGVLKDYFNGSYSAMTSFFAKEKNLSLEDLNELFEETKQQISDEDE